MLTTRCVSSDWATVLGAGGGCPGATLAPGTGLLTSSQIGVAGSDAESGLIDTQYVTLQDRPLPTRFRFQVDTGVQRNTSELHIVQQNQSGTDAPYRRRQMTVT